MYFCSLHLADGTRVGGGRPSPFLIKILWHFLFHEKLSSRSWHQIHPVVRLHPVTKPVCEFCSLVCSTRAEADTNIRCGFLFLRKRLLLMQIIFVSNCISLPGDATGIGSSNIRSIRSTCYEDNKLPPVWMWFEKHLILWCSRGCYFVSVTWWLVPECW